MTIGRSIAPNIKARNDATVDWICLKLDHYPTPGFFDLQTGGERHDDGSGVVRDSRGEQRRQGRRVIIGAQRFLEVSRET